MKFQSGVIVKRILGLTALLAILFACSNKDSKNVESKSIDSDSQNSVDHVYDSLSQLPADIDYEIQKPILEFSHTKHMNLPDMKCFNCHGKNESAESASSSCVKCHNPNS